MISTEITSKIMVDLILYNRLGPSPTVESIESLLDKYKTGFIKVENPRLLKHLIDRLVRALQGESLYADWHKVFRKRVQEILKRS